MKQLVSILALIVAILYVGETNGDEPQASSPLNWGKQEWQKPKPAPQNNTQSFLGYAQSTRRHNYNSNYNSNRNSNRHLNVISCKYVIVYYYNQFGNRVYYYRPVYNTNVYIRNYNRSQYNGSYFGSFIFGGWR